MPPVSAPPRLLHMRFRCRFCTLAHPVGLCVLEGSGRASRSGEGVAGTPRTSPACTASTPRTSPVGEGVPFMCRPGRHVWRAVVVIGSIGEGVAGTPRSSPRCGAIPVFVSHAYRRGPPRLPARSWASVQSARSLSSVQSAWALASALASSRITTPARSRALALHRRRRRRHYQNHDAREVAGEGVDQVDMFGAVGSVAATRITTPARSRASVQSARASALVLNVGYSRADSIASVTLAASVVGRVRLGVTYDIPAA